MLKTLAELADPDHLPYMISFTVLPTVLKLDLKFNVCKQEFFFPRCS